MLPPPLPADSPRPPVSPKPSLCRGSHRPIPRVSRLSAARPRWHACTVQSASRHSLQSLLARGGCRRSREGEGGPLLRPLRGWLAGHPALVLSPLKLCRRRHAGRWISKAASIAARPVHVGGRVQAAATRLLSGPLGV
ncbi:uncharacterized protein BDZ99DRAFT_460295 [Mytilinidion resinicola]|uniref:Uncharacterized protein n=1 Tax=Mytilinidion resinicola TaxID=574789 RepID=A0A6A6YWN0_9PEZI|nr:uncharacterized protein BDZ99DRAFT_460295 [Mytilinidion resinicola]KAF2812968.1 hypothetical protein BDZ99DRAFT_460295 [Mytilinidion resinicola]